MVFFEFVSRIVRKSKREKIVERVAKLHDDKVAGDFERKNLKITSVSRKCVRRQGSHPVERNLPSAPLQGKANEAKVSAKILSLFGPAIDVSIIAFPRGRLRLTTSPALFFL